MKRWPRLLIVGVLLLYGGSYFVWSRLALADAAVYGSEGFYFFPLTKSDHLSDCEFPIAIFYSPCIFLDERMSGDKYSSAPLSDLS
jgi:hypothetical protein